MYQEASAKDKPAEPPLGKVRGNRVGIPGRDGWGCTARGGALPGLKASPALPGCMRKSLLDTEESNPSVRVQKMREKAGLSTLWGPALHWPWFWKKKKVCLFACFLKKSSCDLKHAKYRLLFDKRFAYCHKQCCFVTVIYFRTRCVSDSVCCTLIRWGMPTSSVAKKVAKTSSTSLCLTCCQLFSFQAVFQKH